MKISELIRYIEETASHEQPLVFYSRVHPEYSTEGWEHIGGDIGDYRAPFIGYITLSFNASNSGISLYRDSFLEWLKSVKRDYGNRKILIELHRGKSSRSMELLEDELWGSINTQDGVRYEISSPPEGPSFAESVNNNWAMGAPDGFRCG